MTTRKKRLEYEDSLPVDLISEILLRVPVRLLLQLRIICRSWNSLISSPEFAMLHLQRSTLTQLPPPLLCWKEWILTDDIMHCSSSQSLILYRRHQPTTFVSYPADGKFIRGSCNGLLCLTEGFFPFETLTLLNPITRSVSPSIPFECSEECGERVFCGFGYDTLHDQYKFVMGCCYSSLITDSQVRSGAIVFTFGANPCWKTVDHPVFPYGLVSSADGIFVSGTLNWIVYDPTITSAIDNDEFEWFVLTFDLETESFGRMCLPIIGRRSHCTQAPQLQVHNNCLSYCFHTPDTPIIYSVWIMKEYGAEESWTKLFAIPIPAFDVGIFPDVLIAPLYMYIPEDHNLLALNGSDGRLFVDNLRQNQLVYHVPDGYYWTSSFLCHESLVSPSHYCSLRTIDQSNIT
ncbi:hypothetical protein HN51_045733 [Arachis hypogaea]|uniref:F-box/kelch-repeat protein At3g23880-like n=1 Tax=Arachis ipaensis TaxID=130454 RepID=UPI0007AF216B|nr:F-box/kelch-repeat protein At3g23880-like [Arachis ipaensis]XP_025670692.1 F-box/kelch-repeat protein At3g23880-like [Arachis hypogaea]XP_025670694.1 F-box/kelch-repeat protein At3g23880-like [Arachis hypogaea]QHN98117.1 F-box/kelch-repeat protein [Arachis hypogaea]